MLQIHNSLTRRKEVFNPINPGAVRMYVCGLTVDDYMHIGHARMLVVFDVVVRYLRLTGYQVTYVRNITDVDDKIIHRAAENGESIAALTERMIAAILEDESALGVLRPDIEPRATQSIGAILGMVKVLMQNGCAYQGPNGDIYFAVTRFRDYGRLSGGQLQDLRAGERVEIDEAKRDALDFVLWKSAKAGEPSWQSPWGAGRPGWHIECSAMATAALGNHFDIHGGGLDLKFPHHENEIAQSESATGEPFVNLWMHNGFVQVDEKKMSKSLGNFFTVREVLKIYPPEVVRYFILSSHYRSPLTYSDQQLTQARASLDRLYLALRDMPKATASEGPEYRTRFAQAMDDDFNTPFAISVLFDLAREVNTLKSLNPGEAAARAALLTELGRILGILQVDPEAYLKMSGAGSSPSGDGSSQALSMQQIEAFVGQRNAARKAKDWKAADRIRAELDANGIVIEDGADGTQWRRK